MKASASEHPSVGLGKDYRLEGAEDASAILTYSEEVIHWTAYPNSKRDTRSRSLR